MIDKRHKGQGGFPTIALFPQVFIHSVTVGLLESTNLSQLVFVLGWFAIINGHGVPFVLPSGGISVFQVGRCVVKARHVVPCVLVRCRHHGLVDILLGVVLVNLQHCPGSVAPGNTVHPQGGVFVLDLKVGILNTLRVHLGNRHPKDGKRIHPVQNLVAGIVRYLVGVALLDQRTEFQAARHGAHGSVVVKDGLSPRIHVLFVKGTIVGRHKRGHTQGIQHAVGHDGGIVPIELRQKLLHVPDPHVHVVVLVEIPVVFGVLGIDYPQPLLGFATGTRSVVSLCTIDPDGFHSLTIRLVGSVGAPTKLLFIRVLPLIVQHDKVGRVRLGHPRINGRENQPVEA